MAVRVHVLRTCDRCGRPIETDGAVPVQQLKQGDTIPVFQRSVVRVIREEPSMDGSAPIVKVFGEFTDLCDPCGNVIDRALDTLLKRHSDEDSVLASSPEAGVEPKRRRAGRTPKSVAPDMPGPTGVVPSTTTAHAPAPTPAPDAEENTHAGAVAPSAPPDAEGALAPASTEGESGPEPF